MVTAHCGWCHSLTGSPGFFMEADWARYEVWASKQHFPMASVSAPAFIQVPALFESLPWLPSMMNSSVSVSQINPFLLVVDGLEPRLSPLELGEKKQGWWRLFRSTASSLPKRLWVCLSSSLFCSLAISFYQTFSPWWALCLQPKDRDKQIIDQHFQSCRLKETFRPSSWSSQTFCYSDGKLNNTPKRIAKWHKGYYLGLYILS